MTKTLLHTDLKYLPKFVAFQRLILFLILGMIGYSAYIQDYVYCIGYVLLFAYIFMLVLINILFFKIIKVSKRDKKIEYLEIFKLDKFHFILGVLISFLTLYYSIESLLINDLTWAIIFATQYVLVMSVTMFLFILNLIIYIQTEQTNKLLKNIDEKQDKL